MGPDDPDLHGLLDTPDGDPPPGADELRAIVDRVPRRRWGWGTVGVATACTLALGLGVGYAVSNHSSSPHNVVATGPGTTSGGAAAQTPAIAGGRGAVGANSSSPEGANGATPSIGYLAERYTYLFSRTAGDITVRGYRLDNGLPGGSAVGCGLMGPMFQAEVSTPKVVGIVEGVGVVQSATQALSAARAEVIGTAEGDPTVVAVAATGTGVAEVRATFPGGQTDSMKPVDGWVALVAPTTASAASALMTPGGLGTLTAVDSSGRALSTVRLSSVAVPVPTRPLLPGAQPPTTVGPGRMQPGVVTPATPSTGSGGSASGSAVGSSGSAGTSSGSAGTSAGASSGSSASSGAISGGKFVAPCAGVTPGPAMTVPGGPAR